jgi:hypothetical protein
LLRHILEPETAARTEIVVGDELVRPVGALLLLGAFQRLGGNDFVLFVVVPPLQHYPHHFRLKLVRHLLHFGVPAATSAATSAAAAAATPAAARSGRLGALHEFLPGILGAVFIGGLPHVLDPPFQHLVVQLAVLYYRFDVALQASYLIYGLQVIGDFESQRLRQLVAEVRL